MKNIIIFSILFITGCVSNNIERINTIANNDGILVASYFEDKFHLQKTGITIFHNNHHQLSTSDWNVNDYVIEEIEKKLSSNYKVIVDERLKNLGLQPKNSLFSKKPIPIKNAELEKIVNEKNAKYLLIINPTEAQDIYFSTNQNIEGYGLYQRKVLSTNSVIQYLQMEIYLFDAITGEFLASNRLARTGKTNSIWDLVKMDLTKKNKGSSTWAAYEKADPSIFDIKGNYTINQINTLKVKNEEFISQLIDKSLELMHFNIK